MSELNNHNHVAKKDFPIEFHSFYHDPPVQLSHFPTEINETCVVVPTTIIDSKKSDFSDPKKKKVDEIHHCKKIGLIENKGRNYCTSQITEQFIDHKEFIEKKYKDYDCCKVGYCVLKAERMSEKIQRDLSKNRKNELYFHHHPKKKNFKIGNCQVYFVKKK